MNTHTIKHTQLGAAAALLLLLCGCPAQFGTVEGPGARGTITLAQGVSSAGYRTLVLRAAPDAPQDPAAPRFPPNHGGGSSEAELALRQGQVLSLASLSMPYDFALGGDYGTSQTERWRVFAWLSHGEGGETPQSGEFYGTAAFTLAPCPNAKGFCMATSGVDIQIDNRAP